MRPGIMRDYVARLRASGGLIEPGAIASAVMVLTALAFFRVALLPEFGAELEMSTFQLGAVTTVFALGRLVADLPGGHFADRLPAGRLMAISSVGVAVGSLVLGLSGSPLPVYLSALLMGLASATTNATGMTYFSHAGGAEHRGTSMAIFSAGLLGGQALGPAVAGLVAAAAGWRFAMYLAAGVAGVVSILIVAGARRSDHTPASAANRPARGGGGDAPRPVVMMVLQSVSFAVLLTLGAVPQTLVPLIGSDDLGLGAAAIGLALGAGGFARFVGTLVGGRLSDRLSRKAALVPGLLVQAAGVGLLAFPPTTATWLVAIVVMSLASYAIPVAATILGDLSDPARVGTQLGRFRFVGDLGLIVGPISISALYEGGGRAAAFVTVAAVLSVVGLLCLRVLPETVPDS